MTANNVSSRSQYNKRIIDGDFTELENLTQSENIKSEQYTYYRCEYINAALRISQIIVAVWEDEKEN
jgi:hypothetical protein